MLAPKLDALARCLARIESKSPFTLERLRSDADLQDIISVNLERAIQQCVDVASMVLAEGNAPAPLTMADGFDGLSAAGWIDAPNASRMRKATGFRNILVHEYEKIDWAIAFKIATTHLEDFKSFARQIVAKYPKGSRPEPTSEPN